MILVFYTQVTESLPEKIYLENLSKLPVSLKEKTMRYRKRQDQINHLFGKILLLEALKETGVENLSLELLHYNQYGRPYIPGIADFNISHSGEYIICAISTHCKIGVDVERMNPICFNDLQCSMTDQQWSYILKSDYPTNEFYRYWTMKESLVKGDSRGLGYSLNQILIDGKIARLGETEWYLEELNINDNYKFCLASDQPIGNIEIREMKIESL